MTASESSCYTVVVESSTESPTTQELRAGLEKGSDEVKIDTLRKILVSTINGNPQVSSDRRVFFFRVSEQDLTHYIAYAAHAYHSIRHAITKQKIEKVAALLLGSVSKVR
jgi:hypothetical protein